MAVEALLNSNRRENIASIVRTIQRWQQTTINFMQGLVAVGVVWLMECYRGRVLAVISLFMAIKGSVGDDIEGVHNVVVAKAAAIMSLVFDGQR